MNDDIWYEANWRNSAKDGFTHMWIFNSIVLGTDDLKKMFPAEKLAKMDTMDRSEWIETIDAAFVDELELFLGKRKIEWRKTVTRNRLRSARMAVFTRNVDWFVLAKLSESFLVSRLVSHNEFSFPERP